MLPQKKSIDGKMEVYLKSPLKKASGHEIASLGILVNHKKDGHHVWAQFGVPVALCWEI